MKSTERATKELCGFDSVAGRCIKSTGHEGAHEYFPTVCDFNAPTERLTDFYPFDAPTLRLKPSE